MNILITFYFNGPALGVAIYARELLRHLIPKIENSKSSVTVACSTDAYNYLSIDETIINHCFIEKKLDSFSSRLAFLLTLPMTQKHSTILHLTNPIAPPRALFKNNKVISVIHDLNEFEQKSKYGNIRSSIRRLLLSIAIKNSDKIVCISNHTKKQIIENFKSPPEIEVIFNGAGVSLPEKDRAPEKKIIIVGRIDPVGKNLWDALKLIDEWHKDDSEICAQFTGGVNKSTENSALEFISEINKRSFTKYLGRTTDNELSELYSTAEFLLFLSKHEGFGLPPFEALRMGCPVVAHVENQAMRELLPFDVAYIDSQKMPPLTQVREIIKNIDWAKSKKTTFRFTWEGAAEKYSNLLANT